MTLWIWLYLDGPAPCHRRHLLWPSILRCIYIDFLISSYNCAKFLWYAAENNALPSSAESFADNSVSSSNGISEHSNAATNLLKWIFDGTKTKVMELVEKIIAKDIKKKVFKSYFLWIYFIVFTIFYFYLPSLKSPNLLGSNPIGYDIKCGTFFLFIIIIFFEVKGDVT